MSIDIRGSSGHILDVTRLGRAKVLSLAQPTMEQNALSEHRTYTVSTAVTPTAGGDYFFYVKNTSQTSNLVISRLKASAASAENIILRSVTGTAAGGTAVTPSNRTVGSSKAAVVECYTAVDITGLTAVNDFERLFMITANAQVEVEDMIARPVVVPFGNAVALVATTGAVAITFMVDMFHDFSDPQIVVV